MTRPVPSIRRFPAVPAAVVVAVVVAGAAATAALVLPGCGERTPPPHVGKVTPAGRVFEGEDFSITVPLRFMGAALSLGASRAQAEQSGLRKAQVEAIATLNEVAIKSGTRRMGLFDGTSNDYERADQIIVHAFPSAYFSRTDTVIADQRLAIWLDAEPVKWERFVLNEFEVDRLRTRLPRFGMESVCYYRDAGETTFIVEFLTKPERSERFFAESEEIMKSFTAK